MIRSVFDSLASLKLTIGLLCAGTVLVKVVPEKLMSLSRVMALAEVSCQT